MNWVYGNRSWHQTQTQVSTPNAMIRWWVEWKKCVCTANGNITFCHCQDEISVSIDPHAHTLAPYYYYSNEILSSARWLVRSCFFVYGGLGVCLFWCEGLIVLPSRRCCIHSTANNHIYENSFTLMSWSYITGLFSSWNEWQHLLTINNDQRLRYSTLIYKVVKQIQPLHTHSAALAGSFTCSGDWNGCGQLVYEK